MILPILYFGNIQYWIDIAVSEEIRCASSNPIPKKSYANRTVIATANGLQTLSIPLVGGRGLRIPMHDIHISYAENWVSKHKMALQSAYSNSPFYEHYIDHYHTILDRKHERLASLNLELFQATRRILKLNQEISVDPNLPADYSQYPPHHYQEINPYPQVFRNRYPFQSDLSILDLIFNLGNRARDYLLPKF